MGSIFLFIYIELLFFFKLSTFCRFCVAIRFHPRHNGQWPPTSKDFLSQILSIFPLFLKIWVSISWRQPIIRLVYIKQCAVCLKIDYTQRHLFSILTIKTSGALEALCALGPLNLEDTDKCTLTFTKCTWEKVCFSQ